MVNNKAINLLIFLLVIISELACQSAKTESYLNVPKGEYKEIVESTFTKQISPKTNSNPIYKKTSEALYIYSGNVLLEKRLTKNTGQRELKTKELFKYNDASKIAERQVFFTQSNSLYIQETFDYDDTEKWIMQTTKDANNKIVKELKVTSRKNNVVEGEGVEERGKVRLQVNNFGQDSIVFLDYVIKGTEMSRKCEYKKDKYGNLIFEKCIQLSEDSLPSIVTSRFEMDLENEEWKKKISDKIFMYIDGKEYHYQDSIIRTAVFTSKPVDLEKKNLVGVWQFEDRGNWVDFKNDSKFDMYEKNRLSANGSWKLESSKNQIVLTFLTGDDKGDNIIWKITSIYKDLLKLEGENMSKYLKRKKTG
jgi:hypothetical protein